MPTNESVPRSSDEFNSKVRLLIASAERELAAFVSAVGAQFGVEQAHRSALDWIDEMGLIQWPTDNSVPNWRKATLGASIRLAHSDSVSSIDRTGGKRQSKRVHSARCEMRSISRRSFIGTAAFAGAGFAALESNLWGDNMQESGSRERATKTEKIRRAMLAGPSVITRNATVAEMDHEGNLTVLRPGTNDWVCVPGDQNVVGRADMCIDPVGMVWLKDLMARKARPTNTSPGLIYMLNGATQHSFIDPFDTTSPAIPIGPHWMVLWPFDATAAGLSSVMRDAGTMVMFAGTPYAHLHICGSPWDGQEYHPGDRAVWLMHYERP